MRRVSPCPTMLVLLTILHFVVSSHAWNPDAGVTTSWTKRGHVTVTSSSGSNANNVNDADDNTDWVSSYCLPGKYFSRDDVNVLKNACHDGHCIMNSQACPSCTPATDGNVYTTQDVSLNAGATKATFKINLNPPAKLQLISLDGIFHDETTSLFVKYSGNAHRHVQKTFHVSDSYKTSQVQVSDLDAYVVEIHVEADIAFSIKEIAAIGENGCTESVTVDLGDLRDVGIIRTRHWAGTNAALSLSLLTSVDGSTWTTVTSLEPEAIRAVTTVVNPRPIRYISLRYNVRLTDYKKVYCFEIDAWDAYGIWGPLIPVRAQRKTLREMLGVNGIWGWGHNAYSHANVPGVGPRLYDAIASHARNYHNLNWDVTDPDNDPEYSEMAAGHGTQSNSWLNWDTEYTAWVGSNLTVDASIQFLSKSFPPSVWDNPEQASFHYGQEFAKHFGSQAGNGLISAMEVGNEPWDYEAGFYATVLRGMTNGVRSVDTSIGVLPGAFQAESKTDTNTYIGTRVLPEVADKLTAINCHTYSFHNDANGVRKGVHPEHAQSSFNNIRPLCRWRDTNMPDKPVWVTEWGWDSSGQGENCTFPECVTEQAQAVYGLRGLAIFSRSTIERATWFFYANLDHNSLFGRSGLTASLAKNFIKKTVFVMFEEILSLIGDLYFLDILQEDKNGYVYVYGPHSPVSHPGTNKKSIKRSSSTSDHHSFRTPGQLQHASHILAWLPIDISDVRIGQANIQLPSNVRPLHGWRFVGNSTVHHTEVIDKSHLTVQGDTLQFQLSTFPVLVELSHSHDVIPVG